VELNFDFQIYISPDGQYGAYDPERGNWTGLVKELIDGKSKAYNVNETRMNESLAMAASNPDQSRMNKTYHISQLGLRWFLKLLAYTGQP